MGIKYMAERLQRKKVSKKVIKVYVHSLGVCKRGHGHIYVHVSRDSGKYSMYIYVNNK